MSQPKLAIVCTHPIQYSAPVFRALAQSGKIDLKVFYTWSQAADDSILDSGFGATLKWDIPLLEGYSYKFVRNVAERPGPDHFWGLDTPTLAQDIEDWRPDALLVYTWSSRSHLQALRHFKGRLPVIFRGDSTLIDHRAWWRARLRRWFLTWVYRHVDVAIAVGSNNRDYFAWCGLPLARIALAPHSVDTVRFAADSDRHEQLAIKWRNQLGISGDALVILFAGKLQYKKDPFLLLEAFCALQDGSHLVMVGNGELESDLKERAQGRANVHFMDFQNQSCMPAVYRLCDVFVLPSRGPEETWGLALNEAMASGRPVIASSKVGGARDLIQPGINGWIFESRDRRALEDVLRTAIARGRNGLRAMGSEALANSEQWSTEASASQICEVVLNLAACSPAAKSHNA